MKSSVAFGTNVQMISGYITYIGKCVRSVLQAQFIGDPNVPVRESPLEDVTGDALLQVIQVAD
jgi:hypothetical protein